MGQRFVNPGANGMIGVFRSVFECILDGRQQGVGSSGINREQLRKPVHLVGDPRPEHVLF